ncbi:MAG: hypothetical protein ACRDD9_10000 [Shewanella sp.]
MKTADGPSLFGLEVSIVGIKNTNGLTPEGNGLSKITVFVVAFPYSS